jgi:hypothetical protein
MHETNNNTVPIDKEPQSLKDGDFKDQILSNQTIIGACRDKVSLSLAKEHNLQEYTGEILNVLYHRNIYKVNMIMFNIK